MFNSLPDVFAFCFFFLSWIGYGLFVERAVMERPGLNRSMHGWRLEWLRRMGERESRIVDTAILNALQNACGFFASTSLIALGGAAALLRSTDDVVRLHADLLGGDSARTLWEIKVLGLAYIYGYAFFKFTWAYRLFNYSAILTGATPLAGKAPPEEIRAACDRAARMNIVAGRHFLIGQRAMFFSFGYLGWFVSPWALCGATIGIIFVIYRRQFHSDALDALKPPPAGGEAGGG